MLTVKGMVRIQNDLSGEFNYGKGVLQDNALACLLLHFCLRKSYEKCWNRFLLDCIQQVGVQILSLIHI